MLRAGSEKGGISAHNTLPTVTQCTIEISVVSYISTVNVEIPMQLCAGDKTRYNT